MIAGITSSIRTLASLKRRGKKVGGLGSATHNSIDLKQYGGTHKTRGSKVKIQNVPGWFLGSTEPSSLTTTELANAKLINKPDGYLQSDRLY